MNIVEKIDYAKCAIAVGYDVNEVLETLKLNRLHIEDYIENKELWKNYKVKGLAIFGDIDDLKANEELIELKLENYLRDILKAALISKGSVNFKYIFELCKDKNKAVEEAVVCVKDIICMEDCKESIEVLKFLLQNGLQFNDDTNKCIGNVTGFIKEEVLIWLIKNGYKLQPLNSRIIDDLAYNNNLNVIRYYEKNMESQIKENAKILFNSAIKYDSVDIFIIACNNLSNNSYAKLYNFDEMILTAAKHKSYWIIKYLLGEHGYL